MTEIRPPGIYDADEYPNDEYHASSIITKSKLDKIHRSPAHFKHSRENPEVSTSRALEVGTAVHTAVLEPHLFKLDYFPDIDPALLDGCLSSTDAIANAIVDYNNDLDPVTSNEELATVIDGYNESLAKPYPLNKSIGDMQDIVSEITGQAADDTLSSKECKSIISEFNNTLKKPLSSKGNREKLLDMLDACLPEYAAKERDRPAPLSTKGSKGDLIDRLLSVCPDARISDLVKQKYYAQAGEAKVISRSDWDMYEAMRDAVKAHPAAKVLLSGDGKPEVSFVAEMDGVPVQCRADWWIPSKDIIVDLKTCENAHPDVFAPHSARYRYHVAEAWYSDVYKLATGRDLKAFVFLALEKSAPYLAAPYVMDGDFTDVGRAEYQADFETYKHCIENDVWPGYSVRISQLTIPSWLRSQAIKAGVIDQE